MAGPKDAPQKGLPCTKCQIELHPNVGTHSPDGYVVEVAWYCSGCYGEEVVEEWKNKLGDLYSGVTESINGDFEAFIIERKFNEYEWEAFNSPSPDPDE